MSQDRRPAGRARGRTARAIAATLLALGLLGAGCGFNAQTSQPYTPADGTNLDVGADNQLKIRNLVVVSRSEGQGFLSTSIVSGTGDRLTSATITPSPLGGSPGPAVAADFQQPIELPGGVLVVLTDGPPVTVKSPGLVAGLAASVTMEFAEAGQIVMNCPVVDGTIPPYSTITAVPSPSPSASPTS